MIYRIDGVLHMQKLMKILILLVMKGDNIIMNVAGGLFDYSFLFLFFFLAVPMACGRGRTLATVVTIPDP